MPSLKGLLVFSDVRAVVEGLDVWSSHDVTIPKPISHNITLSKHIGWTTICFVIANCTDHF